LHRGRRRERQAPATRSSASDEHRQSPPREPLAAPPRARRKRELVTAAGACSRGDGFRSDLRVGERAAA
jgi:hypothetical protein